MAEQNLFIKIWPYLLALILGLLIGYTDLHNDEIWAVFILMLPLTFLCGFLRPHQAWQWAFLLGGGIPIGYFFALLIGYTLPCHPGLACPPLDMATVSQTLLALIPALLGVYSGVWLRWGLSQLQS